MPIIRTRPCSPDSAVFAEPRGAWDDHGKLDRRSKGWLFVVDIHICMGWTHLLQTNRGELSRRPPVSASVDDAEEWAVRLGMADRGQSRV